MGENIDFKKIDPVERNKYEQELEAQGMPAELDPVALERDEKLERIVLAFPELKNDMLKFKAFSDEIKTYIADQLLKLYEDGIQRDEIIRRLRLLVDKMQDFTSLDGTDSDKKHKPQMTPEEEEMRDLDTFAEAGASGHIERAEEIIQKEKSNQPEIKH